MPVSSLCSPELTAGSIATTIRVSSGRARSGAAETRAASMRLWFHKAPGMSSRISPSSSWRPRAGTLVAADDLREKGRRQMLPVLDRPAASDDDFRVGQQLTDQLDRPRRRGDDDARV